MQHVGDTMGAAYEPSLSRGNACGRHAWICSARTDTAIRRLNNDKLPHNPLISERVRLKRCAKLRVGNGTTQCMWRPGARVRSPRNSHAGTRRASAADAPPTCILCGRYRSAHDVMPRRNATPLSSTCGQRRRASTTRETACHPPLTVPAVAKSPTALQNRARTSAKA